MSISVKNLSKNLVLSFLLCKELKLDFDRVQVLFVSNEKVFWKYMFTLLPALRITNNRFFKLNELSIIFYNRLMYPEKSIAELSEQEQEMFKMVENRLENKFEYDGELYTFQDFIEYFNFNKSKNININIMLIDGSYISSVTPKEITLYENNIKSIIVDKKEYIRTSNYSFYTNRGNSVE